MAHACSNTYEPVLSLYVVFAGAYIIHEPPGLDAIQLVAVPADVWPDGHEVFAISMCSSTTATYPDGHDVDGSAAIAHTGAIARTNTIIRFIVAPISQKVNQTAQIERSYIPGH